MQAPGCRWSHEPETSKKPTEQGGRSNAVPLFCAYLVWRSRQGYLAKATWQTGVDLPETQLR